MLSDDTMAVYFNDRTLMYQVNSKQDQLNFIYKQKSSSNDNKKSEVKEVIFKNNVPTTF